MTAWRAAHHAADPGGPLDREIVPELRLAPDSDERPQQRVMADHRLIADLGPRVDDGPGADNRAHPDHRLRACAGVDVPDRVPLLRPTDDDVLLQPRAIPDPRSAADHCERADMTAVPQLDRPGRALRVGRDEHRQRADHTAPTD